MILHQAYLHIFDKNSGNLLLSQKELPLSNPYITEYFTKIIEKTLKSDPRHGVLPPEEPLLGFLADDSIPFIEKTQQLAHKLYEKQRLPETSEEEKESLSREMDKIFNEVPIPPKNI